MRKWNNDQDIQDMTVLLQKDNIFITSSDTVLGLLAQVSLESKNKIDAIKQRNKKPYLVLARSFDVIKQYIDLVDLSAEDKIKKCWPGPVTFIFKANDKAPHWMVSDQGTIGVRVPLHDGLQKILASTQFLFSTSANISGQPVPSSVQDVSKEVLDCVYDVCIDDVEKRADTPSTIVDATSYPWKIIRQGAFIIPKS